ncbi:MAG: oligosaccharide flippase family protein [Gemmatimonadota bacterium]
MTAPAEPAIRKGIRGGYLNLVVTWVVQLVMVPLLLHRLGSATYGLYAALTAVAGYFALLTFGSALTVPRYVADLAARGEAEALNAFVSTYLVAFLAVGVVGLAIGLAATPLLARWMVVPEELRAAIAPAWRLVLGGWAIGLAAGLFQSLLTGLGEVQLANLANSARTALNLAVAAAVLGAGGRLSDLLVGLIAATLVSSLALYVLVRRRHPGITLSFAHARFGTLRVTLKPTAYYFLMQLAAVVVMGTDNIVIGVFLGVERVAAYAVAFQLWAIMLAVLWSGGDVLLPFFARWSARSEAETLRRAFLKSTKYAFAGSVLAAIVLTAYGQRLILWWVGPALVVDRRVLWVFAFMLLIATPIHTAALVLAGMGRHRAPAVGGAVEAALNIVLSLLLVRPLGVLGVALGTAISGVLTNAWIAPRAAGAELEIGLGEYLRGTLGPALAPGLLAGAVAMIAGQRAAGGAGVVVAMAAVAVVFVVAFWMVGLDAEERRAALKLVSAESRT